MVAATTTSTATTTTPAAGGKDKPMVRTRTLVCLDCLVVTTMAVTVEEEGGGVRLQERTELVSGSSVLKISWEEEITAAVTVDTTNTLRTTTLVTTTPATTTPVTTTPATTTNSRVDASVTTSLHSEI